MDWRLSGSLAIRLADLVKEAKKDISSLLECDELGQMDEYMGCKVERNMEEHYIKLTQPALLQSYEDEFDLDEHGLTSKTSAESGSVLSKEEGESLQHKDQKNYRSGVGKLPHMTR